MKHLFTLVALAAFFSLHGFSQDSLQHHRDTVFLKKARHPVIVTDRPPQAVYAEIWGKALFFSANYDRRFSKRLNGLGFSAGAGYLNVDGLSLFSVPVGLNYLLGNNGKYFEVGAGASYLSASLDDFGDAASSGSTVIGTMTIGYRSQPIKGGFMFRVGINPIFFKKNFVPYYPYVSFGYNF
jgi:hypothetical protein